jgi:hypothetical protein
MGGDVPAAVSRERAAELRAIAESKAVAYRASRISGAADVVVVGDGPRREGLTEDYLTVALEDGSMARRSRFGARLAVGADGKLVAAVG